MKETKASHVEQLEQRLKNLVDRQPGTWTMLARDWLRNTLRRSVRIAGESAEEEDVLRRCWNLARQPTVLEGIRDAQTRISSDCQRLHCNLEGLMATAAAAAAAVRAMNAVEQDPGAPLRMRQWLEHSDSAIGAYPALQKRPDVLQDLITAEILAPAAFETDGVPPLMNTHRTIGEYLVARAIAHKLQKPDAPEWEMIDKKAWDPQWRPVLLFLPGLVSESPATIARYVKLCRQPETDPKQTTSSITGCF
jgi:hypothetical protein